MKTLRDSTLVNYLFTRIGLAILVLVIYLWAWRPLRIITAEQVVTPVIQSLSEASTIDRMETEGKKIVIFYPYDEGEKKLTYSPQAGFFFLVAVTGLLFVTLRIRYFGMLWLFHLFVELLVWGALWLGLRYSVAGYVIAGFLIGYFSPAVSLAFVPLVYKYEKMILFEKSPSPPGRGVWGEGEKADKC